jgi:Flp pilus assembly protein TadG
MRTRRVGGNLRRDERGASAVEFALIAPVMLILLLGTFEMTRAFSAQRKVVAMAATVNRLVAGFNVLTPEQLNNPEENRPGVTEADLEGVVNAAKAVLFPLDAADGLLEITIDRIDRQDDAGIIKWTYDWQTRQGTNSPASANADYVPTRNSVVRTRITYTHRPIFTDMVASFGIPGFSLQGTAIGGGEGDPTTNIDGHF